MIFLDEVKVMFAYFENHAKLLHNMKDCVGVWQVQVGILEFI